MTARGTYPEPARRLRSGNNAVVTSTAPAASAERFPSSRVHSLTRPNLVSVGTIIWLSSELMFFAGLFAMYFTVRANNLNHWPVTQLNVWYATPFTILLVASSVTCQLGVFDAERGNVYGLRRWFVITFIMGFVFVLGQANEYRMNVSEYHHLVNGVHESGMTLSSSGYGSVFYLTTGFHGLHVIGGLIAFVFFLARTALGRFTPAQATAAIVVSYYWHFVDIVWIGLFATIYLIQ
ncbi:MAG: cytochrome c oxidase subunit [Pseudonocardiales bacterium]|nr:cytochrome c oxidase subunit [Pseudonocardiales bacterium]